MDRGCLSSAHFSTTSRPLLSLTSTSFSTTSYPLFPCLPLPFFILNSSTFSSCPPQGGSRIFWKWGREGGGLQWKREGGFWVHILLFCWKTAWKLKNFPTKGSNPRTPCGSANASIIKHLSCLDKICPGPSLSCYHGYIVVVRLRGRYFRIFFFAEHHEHDV